MACLMQWWKEWKAARRARRIAAMRREAREAEAPVPVEEHVSVNTILSEIERNRLELTKLEFQNKIEELKATAAERAEQREYDRKEREKEKERRIQNAERMREARKNAGKGPLPRGPRAVPATSDCADCIAILTTGSKQNRAHANDMLRHARERHDDWFKMPNAS
jgi:hypothetical protein